MKLMTPELEARFKEVGSQEEVKDPNFRKNLLWLCKYIRRLE